MVVDDDDLDEVGAVEQILEVSLVVGGLGKEVKEEWSRIAQARQKINLRAVGCGEKTRSRGLIHHERDQGLVGSRLIIKNAKISRASKVERRMRKAGKAVKLERRNGCGPEKKDGKQREKAARHGEVQPAWRRKQPEQGRERQKEKHREITEVERARVRKLNEAHQCQHGNQQHKLPVSDAGARVLSPMVKQ